jgi:hypothetical protein
MLKFLKRAIIIWVLFIAISITGGGGDQFRWFFDKTGLVSQKVTDWIVSKADSLKDEADAVRERVKEWTGGKKKIAKIHN